MYDPDFERQVRAKMDELKFSPSEAVWSNVQSELQKDKKRKRPLAWFFLLAGLVLAGGIYLLFVSASGQHGNSAISKTVSPIEQKAVGSANKNPIDKPIIQPTVSEAPGLSLQKESKPAQKNGISFEPRKPNYQISQKSESGIPNQTNSSKAESTVQNKNAVSSPNESAAVAGASLLTINNNNVQPPKNDSHHAEAATLAKAVNTESSQQQEKVAKAKKQSKHSPWKFGFTGDAGASNVFHSAASLPPAPASSYYNPSFYYNSSNTTSSVLGAAPPPPNHIPADAQAGFSFGIGAFVQKSIGRKVYFTAGLNYHYYSTSQETGSKVADNNLSLATTSSSSYLYGSTQSYNNQYHFLELPISLGYRIMQSKKHPLSIEAGFSLAQLISSNALSYDNASATYVRKDQFMNKTQVLGNAALMAGFNHGKISFQLGPEFQYGLTNMLNSSSLNKEHVFFGGIKMVLQFNK